MRSPIAEEIFEMPKADAWAQVSAVWNRRAKSVARMLVFVAMIGSSMAGQFPAPANGAGIHARRNWNTVDGLPQNTVNATLQTRDGFLWVGTNAGLARFDGVRFRAFGLQDGLRSV